jgi:hypothetical protein
MSGSDTGTGVPGTNTATGSGTATGGGSRWTVLEKALGLVTAAFALLTAFLVWRTTQAGSDQQDVTIRITALQSTIGWPTSISGTVEGLPGGGAVWVFNRPLDTQLFRLAAREPCPVDDNTWSCPRSYVGGKVDRQGYEVVAIAVDASIQQQLHDYVKVACNSKECLPLPLPDWVAHASKSAQRG